VDRKDLGRNNTEYNYVRIKILKEEASATDTKRARGLSAVENPATDLRARKG
jgi:hypothetical protein